MSDYRKVLTALKQHGLLLQQDKTLPSVVGLIAGQPLSTSWWGHPKGQQIFACLSQLADRDDVLMTRLLGRKITWLHQRLWPAFLSIATSGEAWQRKGLSTPARRLLRGIEKEGWVRATGAATRELQERLLVDAIEVHTETGRHAMELRSWEPRIRNLTLLPPGEAKESIERAVGKIGAKASLLPW